MAQKVVIIDYVPTAGEDTGLYDRYAHVRERVQSELNRDGKLEPISFEVYKKTEKDRVELANVKRKWKQMQKGLV